MNGLSAAVGDFRPQRKCFSISGSLLFGSWLLLLLVAQCACRPPDEQYDNFDAGEEYGDVDNVELHHVQIVDGIMMEDHPIIMYKEDFVSADYDPSKNNANNDSAEAEPTPSATPPTVRQYKDITKRRRQRPHRNVTEEYHALKPEKMYFDDLPPTPQVATEAADVSDDDFDPAKMHVDVISLVDLARAQSAPEEPSKELLSKRPKKYRRRVRRDTTDEHKLQKRNPYLRHAAETSDVSNYLQQIYQVLTKSARVPPQSQTFSRHAVPGKLWNSINLPVSVFPPPDTATGPQKPTDVENRDGFNDDSKPSGGRDRVLWGSESKRPNRLPVGQNSIGQRVTTRRPAPPLFHDARPENDATLSSIFTLREEPQQQQLSASPVQWATTTAPARAPARTISGSSETRRVGIRPEVVQTEADPQCDRATTVCCVTFDPSVRYECFRLFSCERSISHIMSTCE